MTLHASQIVVGGIYATLDNQERKVTAIDDSGVRYLARPNTSGRWRLVPGASNPCSIETFVNACDRIVSLPK